MRLHHLVLVGMKLLQKRSADDAWERQTWRRISRYLSWFQGGSLGNDDIAIKRCRYHVRSIRGELDRSALLRVQRHHIQQRPLASYVEKSDIAVAVADSRSCPRGMRGHARHVVGHMRVHNFEHLFERAKIPARGRSVLAATVLQSCPINVKVSTAKAACAPHQPDMIKAGSCGNAARACT